MASITGDMISKWRKEQEDKRLLTPNQTCPFCCETEFDLIMLSAHLKSGQCDDFNQIGEKHENSPHYDVSGVK